MFEETKLWDWSCECRGLCRNLDRSDKSISFWVNYENATQRPLTVVNSFIRNYNQVTKLIKLWHSLIHFCRSCKFGRYSDNYLLQSTSARYWTCFQRRWQYKSFLTKTPGGKFKCDRINKWLAIKDSESIGLHATVGRPLRIPSTSAINVGSASPEPIVA